MIHDTQPIPTHSDDDATLVFAPPRPAPSVMETAQPPRRTWLWGVLFSVIGVLLLIVGLLLGAHAVSQETFTQAEMDQAGVESTQDGYDQGYADATEAAEDDAEAAHQSGYEQGYEDGLAAGSEEAQLPDGWPTGREEPTAD